MYFMGLNQGAMGEPKSQISYLGKAYSLQPKNPKYGYNYILTLYQFGDKTEAKKVLSSVLKSDPNNQRYLELDQYFKSDKN